MGPPSLDMRMIICACALVVEGQARITTGFNILHSGKSQYFHWNVGVGFRAVAELAGPVEAPGPDRPVSAESQHMRGSSRYGLHVGEPCDLDGNGGIGVCAITELPDLVVAPGPDGAVASKGS